MLCVKNEIDNLEEKKNTDSNIVTVRKSKHFVLIIFDEIKRKKKRMKNMLALF
jgi:hypothetical protein